MSALKDILGLPDNFQIPQILSAKVFASESFHPIIALPEEYEVFDFSQGYDPERNLQFPFGIGKYNEHRPTMYEGEQFHYEELQHQRTVHMGIDIAAPVGTEIYAFEDGYVFAVDNNDLPFDYGPTLITKHEICGFVFWALYGHLRLDVLQKMHVGKSFKKGDIIAHIGDKNENGGWNPHVHFQLSTVAPPEGTCDLPGVVSLQDRELATRIFPDPRLVLGQLYGDFLSLSC